MVKNIFWDLTRRPYTQLKLKILHSYLCGCWAKIFFNKAFYHKNWKSWQEMYYVDCFAGRGKYDCDGKKNIINGSPLIALECAKKFQSIQKYDGIKMKCIFVENKKQVRSGLIKFCEDYKRIVDFDIYGEDINIIIDKILSEIDRHPAFFFIDPDGIKELKKETVEKIVNRSVATDVLLNYIKGGVERLSGLAKKELPNIINQSASEKVIKTIGRLKDFYGTEVFKSFDKNERGRLEEWTDSILKSSELKEVAVFDMPYLHKSDIIYYLLFASRESVAKKVMTEIFKTAKKTDYKGQLRMDIFDNKEFEI